MTREIDEDDLTVGKPKRWAAGLPAVLVSLKRSVEQMGTTTTVTTLRLLNQRDGFDCPGLRLARAPRGRRWQAQGGGVLRERRQPPSFTGVDDTPSVI